MVRQRVYGIVAGYEDQNDHDTLRYDPIFQTVCDQIPDDSPQALLASQPTLSRFENAIDISALFRLRELFVTQFMDSFPEPPSRLTFDLDGFDDPAHGQQQLTMFHGYYKQNQDFPLSHLRWALKTGDQCRNQSGDDDRAAAWDGSRLARSRRGTGGSGRSFAGTLARCRHRRIVHDERSTKFRPMLASVSRRCTRSANDLAYGTRSDSPCIQGSNEPATS